MLLLFDVFQRVVPANEAVRYISDLILRSLRSKRLEG
jgi:hypothetical protein